MGKSSLQDLLNVGDTGSSKFRVQHIQGGKRKRGESSDNLDLNIDIPGFSGSISTRKLYTFIAAGPRLIELLNTLNNNWVLLDIVDSVTITWLENFRNNEWDTFIKEIKSS